jgi:hypothetical protein
MPSARTYVPWVRVIPPIIDGAIVERIDEQHLKQSPKLLLRRAVSHLLIPRRKAGVPSPEPM